MFALNIKPYQRPVINLAPSKAEQWLSCPLSAVLTRELRGSSGCYSGQVVESCGQNEKFIEQGVLAHKLAEETINYLYFGGEKTLLKTSKSIEEAVNDYILILNQHIQDNNSNIVMFAVEQPVSIELDDVSKKSGLTCRGTVDAVLVTTQSIQIFDLNLAVGISGCPSISNIYTM